MAHETSHSVGHNHSSSQVIRSYNTYFTYTVHTCTPERLENNRLHENGDQ